MLETDAVFQQVIGQRESQQDSGIVVRIDEVNWLLILADGMGGQVGGKEASQMAVDIFQKSFLESELADIRERLLHALQEVNYNMFDYVEKNPDMGGMGTTLIAAVTDGSRLQWLSIGDSPFWLFSDGELLRLNENHSMAAVLQKQVEAGEITAEEAAHSPVRSQLLEAVMGEDIEMIDLPDKPIALKPDDILVLASDGVESCSEMELQDILALRQNEDCDTIALEILSAVEEKQKSGQDNASLVIFQVKPDESDIDTVPGKKAVTKE